MQQVKLINQISLWKERKMIKEKINLLNTYRQSFADRKRLEEGKTYVPLPFKNYLFTYLALIYRLKPVMEGVCNEKDLPKIKKALKESKEIYNLQYKISSEKFLINSPKDESDVVYSDDPREGIFSYSLSYEKKKVIKSEKYFLEKSKKTDKAHFFSRKFALLMGYPECCVDFGDTLSGNLDSERMKRENFIWSKAHIRSFMNSRKISPLLKSPFINLQDHTPCHLNCLQSKKYVERFLKIIEKEEKNLLKVIRYFFDCYSLIWYYSEFILFKGEKKKEVLFYEDFLPISYSSEKFSGDLSKNFKEKFKKSVVLIGKGNRIKMEEKYFVVYKNNKIIGKVKKDYPFECALF